jgi:predicted O-methyltransferase YrrM
MIKQEWLSVKSMTTEIHEYTKLEEWASEICEKFGEDQTFIEIGSFHGRSTVLLAQYARVLAIDWWTAVDGGGGYPHLAANNITPFIDTMKKFNLFETRVYPIICSSEVLNVLAPQGVPLIFIDGDHRHEPCLKDLQKSHKHLLPGGYLVVHDFQRQGPIWPDVSTEKTDRIYGVSTAVHEYMDNNVEYELKEHIYGIICFKKL